MATDVTLEPATLEHLDRFALEFTEADDVEARGNGWPSARVAFAQFIEESPEAWAVLLDGRVGCMLGVRPRQAGPGMLFWFHSVAFFTEHARPFLRVARALMQRLLDCWRELHAVVDPGNLAMVRLSTWLGFVLEPINPGGPLFHHAVLRRC